jgi:preprotein translocase subunit SecB
MLSALQLDDYIVDELRLETSQLYLTDPEKAQALDEEDTEDEIGFGFELFTDSEANHVLGLRMVVDVNGDIEGWTEEHRYRARISVVGQFSFQDDRDDRPPADEIFRFFMQSSISILYGVIRTRLADATSGQPYSKLMLPTMDFTPFIEDMELEEENKEHFRRLAPPSESAE